MQNEGLMIHQLSTLPPERNAVHDSVAGCCQRLYSLPSHSMCILSMYSDTKRNEMGDILKEDSELNEL